MSTFSIVIVIIIVIIIAIIIILCVNFKCTCVLTFTYLCVNWRTSHISEAVRVDNGVWKGGQWLEKRIQYSRHYGRLEI